MRKHNLVHDQRFFCIYVEPLARVNHRLYESGKITNMSLLIHGAVSDQPGLAPFYEYAGVSGVASSLSQVTEQTAKKEEGKRGPYVHGKGVGLSATAVLTLKHILDAIPKHLRILQMKTDMQGHDFRAIRSAGDALRRIDEIYNECTGEGYDVIYQNEDNRYTDMAPYMQALGFESGKSRSHDCNWRRVDGNGRAPERIPGAPYIGKF